MMSSAAGLRTQDRTARPSFAQHERTNAQRIAARRSAFLLVSAHQGVGAFRSAESASDETLDDASAPRSRGQQEHDLPWSDVDWQIAPALMSSRRSVRPLVRLPFVRGPPKPPASSSANSGCTFAQDGAAGGGVADMADGRPSLEAARSTRALEK